MIFVELAIIADGTNGIVNERHVWMSLLVLSFDDLTEDGYAAFAWSGGFAQIQPRQPLISAGSHVRVCIVPALVLV
jgi:hypothetical protein